MIYEIMTVIPATVAENELDASIALVSKEIEGAGAKIEKVENLGKLKLAYPIDRQRYGYYVLFFVDVATEGMAKINETLRLSENTLRHLIIAREGGIPTASYKMVQYTQPLSAEGRRGGERAERKSDKKLDAPASEEGAAKSEDVVAEKVEENA